MARPAILRPANLLWLGLYLAMLATLWAGMAYGRATAIEVYGSPEAQQDWEQWVDDARDASQGGGPVRRRVPKATAPPAYLLMTEHFSSCLIIATVLSSALFFTMMVLIRGVVRSRR